MAKRDDKFTRKFYGTTIIGERGQVVVPAEARAKLKLKKSDKLLVFGLGDMIALTKLAHVEVFAADLERKLHNLKKIIRTNKK